MTRLRCGKCGKECDVSELYVCSECGSFLCGECNEKAEELCPNCYGRTTKLC